MFMKEIRSEVISKDNEIHKVYNSNDVDMTS